MKLIIETIETVWIQEEDKKWKKTVQQKAQTMQWSIRKCDLVSYDGMHKPILIMYYNNCMLYCWERRRERERLISKPGLALKSNKVSTMRDQ